MSYIELSRGSKGEKVAILQSYLNRVGAMLIVDSDFGSSTDRGVRYAQDIAGHSITGVADAKLWEWLMTQLEPFPPLTANGIAFIALEETGGLWYYEINTKWPCYPGVESGITIGVGYDLRMNSIADFRNTWRDYLDNSIMRELEKDIQQNGTKKRADELKKLDIQIPFKNAWQVFVKYTLPEFYNQTISIYPSLNNLPDLCREALVSIVFNRGANLKGDRRKEMKEIQAILSAADKPDIYKAKRKIILAEVEDQIISMKRLWSHNSGVFKRRQTEANLWRAGIERW